MLASTARALVVAAAVAVCASFAAQGAETAAPKPTTARQPAAGSSPARKPAASSSGAASTAKKKKPAATVKKPALPPPPPPPPPVELIGHVIMPPGAFRAGPPSGQFDGNGRRAAAPRFESQPVQGVSSIKPGPTSGAWWALSDNGFGSKWNSPDYRLCIYLFDVRPRTEAGPDSRTALQAVVELSDPAKFFPWRLTEENDPERPLTGGDIDPESFATLADETFWIGDEFGPWLLHFSVDGDLLEAPIELPDNVRSPDHPLVLARKAPANLAHSRGFEALDVAGDGKTLVTILEGAVDGEPPQFRRVQRFDTMTRKWLPFTLIYELDTDTISVSDMSRIEGNRFVVVERDGFAGDSARAKRVYAIDLDKARPGKPLPKKLVIDLLSIGNARGLAQTAPEAPFRFPYLTTESIQVLDRKHVVLVNDNNYPSSGGRGVATTDATEWIWLELANPL
ncbi:MAG TPA: esterase-like activity of phytase family protein [Steroidobacteraceae bacterium]|nr:esterase-like activity of phytase family protein [Steroidobacteraceae bacterium]